VEKKKRNIWFVISLVLAVSFLFAGRIVAEEVKANETGIFKRLGEIDDFNKEKPFYIWTKER